MPTATASAPLLLLLLKSVVRTGPNPSMAQRAGDAVEGGRSASRPMSTKPDTHRNIGDVTNWASQEQEETEMDVTEVVTDARPDDGL